MAFFYFAYFREQIQSRVQNYLKGRIRFRNKFFRIRAKVISSTRVPVLSYGFSDIITNMHDFHVML